MSILQAHLLTVLALSYTHYRKMTTSPFINFKTANEQVCQIPQYSPYLDLCNVLDKNSLPGYRRVGSKNLQ